MDNNGIICFIDELDSCINEVIISGDEFIEDGKKASENNLTEKFNDMLSKRSQSQDNEWYLSESTEAMTDSEFETQSKCLSNDHLDKIKLESETFRDLSNKCQLSLRPRRLSNEKSSVISESTVVIKKEPKIKRKPNIITVPPEDIYIGKILWAKVKSHPWWPCMIYQSPDKTFYRQFHYTKTVHVAYFGPFVERGWVSIRDTIPYEGKAKFDDFVKQLQENNSPKNIIQQYYVSSTKLQVFTESWKEAEQAMMLSLDDRIRIHGISYKRLLGESDTSDSDIDMSESQTTVHYPSIKSEPTVRKRKMLCDKKSLDSESQIEQSQSSMGSEPCAKKRKLFISNSNEAILPESKIDKSEQLTKIEPVTCSDDYTDIISLKSPRGEPLEFVESNAVIAADSQESVLCESRLTNSQLLIKNEPCSEEPSSKIDDDLIAFEFEHLITPLFSAPKRIPICFLCTQDSSKLSSKLPRVSVVNCAGMCGQQFHIGCNEALLKYVSSLEPLRIKINYQKCVDCNRGVRRCFLCQKLAIPDKKDNMMKCSTASCGRYYHSRCLYAGPHQQLMTFNRSGQLTCPSHICHSCYIDNPSSVRDCPSHVRCLMCPAAFHRGQWCIPAGSKEINSNYIICPQHLSMGGCSEISLFPFIDCVKNGQVQLSNINFKLISFNDLNNKDLWQLETPVKCTSKWKPCNVTWCFICPKEGSLICCEKCPASFHVDCINIQEVPDMFVCEECVLGKYPRYGDIYWLKSCSYRWWPGQIVHPSNAPDQVLRAPHGEGQFLVQFFGTNDYYWLNKTHAFPFDEGDDEMYGGPKKSSANKTDAEFDNVDNSNHSLDHYFKKSLKVAAKAWEERQNRWKLIIGRENKPSQYRSIKTNIPIANVRINKLGDLAEAPQCECRPIPGEINPDPCGQTSDCVNRELMYECNPLVCRNGDQCRNQRFVRRNYPRQEVFRTPDRGWALRTLDSLKKGDFVNEYVGELIDESEAARRLKKAHNSNNTNFYMMRLDGQRIIDAGPAANLSRFMNHSCSPNLYTQKWTVNGDTRIGLFALHKIESGTELTFNYNFFSLGQMKQECKCGASNCSGFLGDPPKVASSSDIVNLDKDHDSETKKLQISINRKSDRKLAITQKREMSEKMSKFEDLISEFSSIPPILNDDCFRCGQLNWDIMCMYSPCSRSYHFRCVGLMKRKKKSNRNLPWLCPSHYCDDCGSLSSYFCSCCTNSYCEEHHFDRISLISDDYYLCSSHENLSSISHGSPTESQNGSTNATFSITGTDSLPSVSI